MKIKATSTGYNSSLQRMWVHRFWIFFFSTWFVLLSGVLDFWIKTPGLKQGWQVQQWLTQRNQEAEALELKAQQLKATKKLLESNRYAQEREIRRVLGYIQGNELVFEFEK